MSNIKVSEDICYTETFVRAELIFFSSVAERKAFKPPLGFECSISCEMILEMSTSYFMCGDIPCLQKMFNLNFTLFVLSPNLPNTYVQLITIIFKYKRLLFLKGYWQIHYIDCVKVK